MLWCDVLLAAWSTRKTWLYTKWAFLLLAAVLAASFEPQRFFMTPIYPCYALTSIFLWLMLIYDFNITCYFVCHIKLHSSATGSLKPGNLVISYIQGCFSFSHYGMAGAFNVRCLIKLRRQEHYCSLEIYGSTCNPQRKHEDFCALQAALMLHFTGSCRNSSQIWQIWWFFLTKSVTRWYTILLRLHYTAQYYI